MRLLLDAHFAPKRIATPLRVAGHDVLALAEERGLDGLTDDQVLDLAAEQRRILVTRNAKDFAPILRSWAEAGHHHPGCILIWSLSTDSFGGIVSAILGSIHDRPRLRDWADLTIAV